MVTLLANYLISYFPCSVEIKLWIFGGGVILPLLFWIQRESVREEDIVPFERREFFGPVPSWVWGPVLVALFLPRFWKIDSLFCWPLGDEGLNGAAAIVLSRHWDWRFFYTSGQAPPLPVWTTAVLLKLGCSPFLSLWLPSAFASLLTVGAGYLAARQFFSRYFSFVVGGVLAFSFSTLWVGRFCHQGIWLPPWTCGCLYFLGRFLSSKPGKDRIKEAAFLGLFSGLGSFTFTPWPVVVFLMGAVVVFTALKGRPRDWAALGCFTTGVFLTLIPFFGAVIHEGYGGHLREVSALNQWDGISHLKVILGYITVLGWGTFHRDGFYLPLQGGFLNPLLTSFFCVGLARVTRIRSWSGISWLLPAGLVLFLPGFLSSGVEGFRVAQALPWLLLVTALGFQPLLDRIPPKHRLGAAAMVFLLSFCFDASRLILPYLNVSGSPEVFRATGRDLARFRAYQAIQELESQKGRGLVLGEWDLSADRTLEFATYPFNAAHNPRIPPSQVRWLALMTDAHYRPFIEKRFPRGQWRSLDADFSKEGARALWFMEVTPENQEACLKWKAADKAFRDLNWGIDHIQDRDCLEKVNRFIREDYSLIQGDPYLESCFWEKTGYFYYYIGRHFPEHLRAARLAVKNGYPAAHLYTQLAELLLLSGDGEGARAAREKARESEKLYSWRP